MSQMKPVFDKYPPEFVEKVTSLYPCSPAPITITISKQSKETSETKTPAFYLYNSFDHLVSYDSQGRKIRSRRTESTPLDCLILSNGTIVIAFEGKEYGNLTIETIQPLGEKQIIALPNELQKKDKYILVEYPKNHVCIWRPTNLFLFDPLNPFTTHQSISVNSTSFQQLDNLLLLNNLLQWTSLNEAKELKNVPLVEKTSVTRWISSTKYLWENELGLFVCSKGSSKKLPLQPFVGDRLGSLFYRIDRDFILVAQWPSWSEHSTQVRLTVFDISGIEPVLLYENRNWFNNQRVGTTPIKTIIGGFRWPYLQTNMMNGPELEIFRLEKKEDLFSTKLICACSANIPCDQLQTTFIGNLAIVQSPDGQYDILNVQRDTNRTLQFREGQMFEPNFMEGKKEEIKDVLIQVPQPVSSNDSYCVLM